jgi:hypothetical protein
VGDACGLDTRRDRRIVGLAGLAPDADAFAYIAAYVAFGFDIDRAYSEVWVVMHHYYTHGVGFAMATGVVAWLLATRPAGVSAWAAQRHLFKVAGLAFLVSLTHVFYDVVAAGPRFPVYPWWPFSDLAWTTSWSWELRDWPNQVITFAVIAATLLYARLAGRSPVESFSYRLDEAVVRIMREGSTTPRTAAVQEKRLLGLPRTTAVRLLVYLLVGTVTAAIVIPVSSELF